MTHALSQAGLPVHEKRGILAQQHIKDLLSILLLLADQNGMGILRAARQREHLLPQSDIEALLLAAKNQRCSVGSLIFHGEAPPTMSSEGRYALTRLAKILQSLCQRAPNVWSLLAQYLFIETSIMRDLLRNAARINENMTPTENGHPEETALLADYVAFLQLARRYDQQQETLRRRLEQAAEEGGEQAEPAPHIQEQLKGFLDYLQVLLRLGQDGGDSRENRQQGAEESRVEEPDIIRVMTVHASKGLEFPVVYLPGLIQRNFPLQAHAHPVPAPAGMLPAESEGKAAHESGESCLFYVGVTRARDQLVLSYSERNGKQKARPSAYLDALLAGLPPERITRLHWQGMVEEAIDMDEQEEELCSGKLPSSQPSQAYIDAVKPSTLKAGNIETYQRCPRQYLYGTIYGFRNEQDAYQLFWQATQKTLEALQIQLSASNELAPKLPTVEEAQDLYSKHWQELGGPALPFAAIYEQHGHEVTALLRDKLQESGDTNWKLRHELAVEAAGKTIHLTVDRVEFATQGKHGKQGDTPVKYVRTRFAKRKEKPSSGTRELLYAQAYRQHHGGQSLQLHFHNLSTGETFP
ncbi:MAG TPA: 3'-5' exonuclease, partial [Ktedonobacteraceae bacterium]